MVGFDANAFMQLFGIIIGVYLFYSGLTGTGAAYKNNYPEHLKAPIAKIMRKLYLAVGAVMTVGGILEYANAFGDEISKYVFWVTTGISAILVIIYIIVIKVKFGKQLK